MVYLYIHLLQHMWPTVWHLSLCYNMCDLQCDICLFDKIPTASAPFTTSNNIYIREENQYLSTDKPQDQCQTLAITNIDWTECNRTSSIQGFTLLAYVWLTVSFVSLIKHLQHLPHSQAATIFIQEENQWLSTDPPQYQYQTLTCY